MGDGIQQHGAEAVTFARGLGFAELFHGVPAFNGNCDQAADRFQSFAREIRAGQRNCAHGTNAHAQRHEADAVLAVEYWLAPAADCFQFIGGKQSLAGSVEEVGFLFLFEKHGRAGNAKTFYDVVGNAVDEAENVIADEKLLAEGVKALDFTAALVGLLRFAAGTGGKLTGNGGGKEKGEKRNPVLRIGDRKLVQRRKKEIVVG